MVIEIFFPSQSGNVIFNTSSNKAKIRPYIYHHFEKHGYIRPNTFNSYLLVPTIGPLHDPVTWYGINYTGTQITQWDFQNEGKSGWTGTSSFVLEVPLRNLCPSVIYSVPCDRIVQRAYTLHSYYVVRSSQTPLHCGEQTQDEFFRELHKTLYFAKVPTYLFGKIFIRLANF